LTSKLPSIISFSFILSHFTISYCSLVHLISFHLISFIPFSNAPPQPFLQALHAVWLSICKFRPGGAPWTCKIPKGKSSPIYTLVWIKTEGTNGSLRRFDKVVIVPTHSHSLAMSCRQAAAICSGQSFSVDEQLKIDKIDPKVKRFAGPRSPWNRWKDGTKMIQEWVRCLPVGFKHVTGFCPYLVKLSYPLSQKGVCHEWIIPTNFTGYA
jgi:hypothetical protein